MKHLSFCLNHNLYSLLLFLSIHSIVVDLMHGSYKKTHSFILNLAFYVIYKIELLFHHIKQTGMSFNVQILLATNFNSPAKKKSYLLCIHISHPGQYCVYHYHHQTHTNYTASSMLGTFLAFLASLQENTLAFF